MTHKVCQNRIIAYQLVILNDSVCHFLLCHVFTITFESIKLTGGCQDKIKKYFTIGTINRLETL